MGFIIVAVTVLGDVSVLMVAQEPAWFGKARVVTSPLNIVVEEEGRAFSPVPKCQHPKVIKV